MCELESELVAHDTCKNWREKNCCNILLHLYFVAFQKEVGSQKITELSAVFRSTSSTLVLRRALPFPEFQKPHLLSHRYSFWLVGGVATQNNVKLLC